MPPYEPAPIDTSGLSLPADLRDLLETLARSNHDVWARLRLAEGWRHGPRRDDQLKEHPCLVPYEGLPESEKEVDRRTVEQILLAILASGYRIEKG